MKKRRQHHVWKAYLRAWATDDQILCLQNGRIFPCNIDGVAVERDFYKLESLTPADLQFVAAVIRASPPDGRQTLLNFVTMFSVHPYLKVAMAAKGAPSQAVEAFLDRKIINAEEDYHSGLEGRVAPIIEDIRRGDLSFYDDDVKSSIFLHFLCVQMLRTKGLLERMRRRVHDQLGGTNDAAMPDLIRSSNVLRHIFATNIGASLYSERKQRRLVLLTNNTNVPFVTGDQPVINLFGTGQDGGEPTFTTLYYPVSPGLSVLLSEPGVPCSYGAGPLSAVSVEALNRRISADSHAQVFGHKAEVLRSLIPARENAG